MDKSRVPWLRSFAPGGLLYLILGATLFAYWPGLSGVFLLDDIPNLAALGEYPALHSLDRVVLFVKSGVAGLFGRPLSLLSFVIHDTYWPTAARPFLLTNVLLHLLNGCLVFWLTYLLMRSQRTESTAATLALPVLVTALWLLHPLNVSTVLYVIQRMTELASLFMLTALVLYTKGRLVLAENKRCAYGLMTVGMLAGLGLGVLSKETAATLPIYILVVEYVIIRSPASMVATAPARSWMSVFVGLPLLSVATWQVVNFERIMKGYQVRPFSLSERLLTEPRVLLDYLGNILVPRRGGTGLFHDDFVISRSLFEPVITLPAILLVIAALIGGLALRRRHPVLSFSVLWFLGGHLLEAGILSLEIYFEHRNYLPMLGPLLGIAYLLVRLLDTRLRLFGAITAIALVATIGLATWQTSTLFGQPVLAAEIWADEHPRSQRAQQYSANIWSRMGDYERAQQRMARVTAEYPDSTSPYIIQYQLACLSGDPFDEETLPETLHHLRTGRYDTAAPEALQKVLQFVVDGRCTGLTYASLEKMVKALQDNPRVNWGRVRRSLLVVEAQIKANQGDMTAAADLVEQALRYAPNLKLSIFHAQLLSYAGLHDEALQVLDEAAQRHRRVNLLTLDSITHRIEYAKRNIMRRKEQAQNPQ